LMFGRYLACGSNMMRARPLTKHGRSVRWYTARDNTSATARQVKQLLPSRDAECVRDSESTQQCVRESESG
jgi:hypothetical protein